MARRNSEKNELLKATRNVSFEQVKELMRREEVLDDYEHPNQKKYPGQRVMVVRINGYCCLVPYKPEPDGDMWLKTIVQS
ncbi:hypothetical protein [Fibrobacter sp.]|uniref:hypothetical protein n=1 Tax=Fibrobacter sp. TaxID=35828 RepID=UPI0025BB521F|nr:hypothetical protein [Fibrobacter sp.]MBR3073309.1 hypothetical protein [Fibrobacter sp.]